MAQKDNDGAEVDEALEVLGMVFVAHHQASKVEQPCEESFNLPATAVSPQASTVLCATAASSIRCNHFRAVFVQQLFVESVAVIRFIPDQLLRHVGHNPCLQRGRHQFHFSWRSTFCP